MIFVLTYKLRSRDLWKNNLYRTRYLLKPWLTCITVHVVLPHGIEMQHWWELLSTLYINLHRLWHLYGLWHFLFAVFLLLSILMVKSSCNSIFILSFPDKHKLFEELSRRSIVCHCVVYNSEFNKGTIIHHIDLLLIRPSTSHHHSTTYILPSLVFYS